MTAVEDPAAAPAPEDETLAALVRSRRRRGRRWQLVGAGVILAGAFAFLLVKGLTGSLNYYETVDQAVAQRATLGSQTFNIEGVVVPGTIHPTSRGVDFVIESSGVRQPIIETGQPPQLFQADIPVVLPGRFDGADFVSSQIIVDHSSQYIARYPNRVRAPNGSVR